MVTLVPGEPTIEMLVAANAAWFIPDPSPFNKGDEARREVWKAMLAAAPSAQGQPTTPVLNIRCESVSPDGVKGSTYLPVVRVEAEDDGSFTAVTNYWPAEPAQDGAAAIGIGVDVTADGAHVCVRHGEIVVHDKFYPIPPATPQPGEPTQEPQSNG